MQWFFWGIWGEVLGRSFGGKFGGMEKGKIGVASWSLFLHKANLVNSLFLSTICIYLLQRKPKHNQTLWIMGSWEAAIVIPRILLLGLIHIQIPMVPFSGLGIFWKWQDCTCAIKDKCVFAIEVEERIWSSPLALLSILHAIQVHSVHHDDEHASDDESDGECWYQCIPCTPHSIGLRWGQSSLVCTNDATRCAWPASSGMPRNFYSYETGHHSIPSNDRRRLYCWFPCSKFRSFVIIAPTLSVCSNVYCYLLSLDSLFLAICPFNPSALFLHSFISLAMSLTSVQYRYLIVVLNRCLLD